MFGQKRGSDQTRIKLPRRSLPPTVDYLQFAFAQALQYRDKEVELTWSDYSNTKVFTLVVLAGRDRDIPLWAIWEESFRGSQFLWSEDTDDLGAIENKISTLDPVSRDLVDNIKKPVPVPQASPYRDIFSNTYHGIKAQPQNSIRDSLTRMRPVSHPRPINGSSINNNQIVSSNMPIVKTEVPLYSAVQTHQPEIVEAASFQQNQVSPQAPAAKICQLILNDLRNLYGEANTISIYAFAENIVCGTLEQTRVENKDLIKIIAANHLSGKLELINQSSGTCQIFFSQGVAYSAMAMILDDLSQAGLVSSESQMEGDQSLTEAVIWSASSFKFLIGEQTNDRNVTQDLNKLIQDSSTIREDLSHLERAGLRERSIMVKKQDGLGESELQLLLAKHSDTDVREQIEIYKRLPKKFTAGDIIKQGPLSKAVWVPIVYRFFTNGLIDIKPPLAINESSLDFTEDGKAAVTTLKLNFIRQETGIFSYPALLYFLQHEYLRFQMYDTPLSFIIFEMSKASTNVLGGLDLINKQETLVALARINAVKRPLDFLGHFEAINYGLLLPNTNIHTAIQMAKQLVKVLSSQPLSPQLDPSLLKLSFGVGSIPEDCKDVEELVLFTKKAVQQSKNGDFLIVQASGIA